MEEQKKAAALRFDPATDRAPRIVASGVGTLAEDIVRTAEESGVKVVEDGNLAGFLLDLPAGIEIPENLYKAVSSIFAMLIRLEGEESSL
ncbi:MAG TPA: EscU/YscU/HrcU family type III secretion system export apparatus switch protein [Leptospiraceae bacterium]|jgi:flagellar biosynthesis protein|nr:EscU/YscU/HrcU family type III secretion system export apparatus switch protein [Leptospirales bacterium]HMU82886.1 EscU/YscU/HrcU family type III secretion system export apparatus switch protein [Leptospiraceae bacterium]HMW61718.1 EscU/YscU/HrcU family type III secretion system export apparatus switch protein [Leptospiraceae bacterium]HMX57952.1 EscU/YscU/HrcU family type III secretion system export apparatus switch protein [Leptospiraceae bacterium]HMZ35691.1 EscU/YscU/HrcU family type II